MDQLERYNLIQKIALNLQAGMNTTGINVLLGGFGIKHDGVDIVGSKRVYVSGLLEGVSDVLLVRIASQLKIPLPKTTVGGTVHLQSYLEDGGLQTCLEDFNRMLSNLEADPDQALGNACSTLESICKSILEKLGIGFPKDQSLQPLLRSVFDALKLSPDKHADPEIKRIVGGLFNASVGIGVLRTQYSAAHGKGASQKRLSPRHIRLAVNGAATVGLFLLETYHDNFPESKTTQQAAADGL